MTKRDIRGMATPLLDWGEQLRATKHKRRILGRRIAITGIGIALLGLTMAFPPAPRLVWNASASAPIGLYAVTPGAPIDAGDMVIARVPDRRSIRRAEDGPAPEGPKHSGGRPKRGFLPREEGAGTAPGKKVGDAVAGPADPARPAEREVRFVRQPGCGRLAQRGRRSTKGALHGDNLRHASCLVDHHHCCRDRNVAAGRSVRL